MLQKHKYRLMKISLFGCAFLCSSLSFGQVLTPALQTNRILTTVEEQYRHQHYAMAAQTAKQYLQNENLSLSAPQLAELEKAKYYLTLSNLKTATNGCAEEATAFIEAASNPAYSQRVAFTLAQYYFTHNNFAKAIPVYENAGIAHLSNSEVADAKFELAYCYFNDKQFDKAEPQLQAIKEMKDGKYYLAGNYYYGLLAYNQNKYREALLSFERIKNAKEYRSIVPYYIAEIYYFTGNRDKALKQADSIINRTEKSFYDNELHLLAAQCLFEEQKYTMAKPYFQYYYDHADRIRKEDLYEIAYCDYKTGEWQNAIEKFKMLSDARDSLGQTSMYLLGDCYLKTGDKKSARNAYGICADMSFNEAQQEASMILYAKISYETGYTDDALRTLSALLSAFPRTHYKDEANTMMSGLLIKTNNFSGALARLKEVSKKDADYKQVYQKATYGYAVQLYRDGKTDSAYHFMTLSAANPANPDYEVAAIFWKGELAYRLKQYNDVVTFSQDFINKRGNKNTVEQISPQATLQHAYLNMGYASMETQNYIGAQNYFGQAQQAGGKDAHSGVVAALKEADAVFLQRNYSRAVTLYDKVIKTDSLNADYAAYQKSILLGLLGRSEEKLNVLSAIMYKDPPSPYLGYARYETAITLIETDKYSEALPFLQKLTDLSGDRSLASKAWMKTGFINQQLNETNKAIDAYKHVVTDYPASEERLPALEALKNLYIQLNQPSAYLAMLKDNRLPSADSSSMDSTYYASAETQFASGKWDVAKQAFTNYLQQFPNGVFAIKAHYYRAESNYQLKMYKEAREDYNITLSGAWNDFVENSARRAAAIAYEEKNYSAAYDFYLKLLNNTTGVVTRELAYDGLMRSGYNSGKFAEAGRYADTLLVFPGASAESINNALYFKAKTLQRIDSNDAATKIYKQLSGNKNGDIAAESRYHIAEILFKQNKLKEAETAANESIKQNAGYAEWVGKSCILLADILVKQDDYFNAKAFLESIVKHTKNADLKKDAAKKLEEVKKLEKRHSKLSGE